MAVKSTKHTSVKEVSIDYPLLMISTIDGKDIVLMAEKGVV